MKKTKTYNIFWLLCYIDTTNWDFHIQKAWNNEKIFSKLDMDTMIKEGKNINRIYKPLPLLLYTDRKAWKISNFDSYAIN